MDHVTAPSPPEGFDPVSQEFQDSPEPFLHDALENSPVFFHPDFNFWVITRYADVAAALSDWETFSSGAIHGDKRIPEEYADRLAPDYFRTGALAALDPPVHTKRRKMLNRGFTRSRMADLETPITAICEELLDGFAEAGSCELMSAYCYEVSLRSIVTLLGLPTTDLPVLRELAANQGAVAMEAVRPLDPEERLERWGKLLDARDYLAAVAEERRRSPGEDMVSVMATAVEEDGSPALSATQVVTHLTELVFAGTETTANLMARVVRMLDQDPAEREAVRIDAGRWPAVIEEALRMRSLANGVFRATTREVEVAGQTIPAGAVVWVSLAAANHDPDRFGDDCRFDPDRANAKDHLSFGKSRHMCMGAPLTRLEAPIGLRLLYERLPNLRVEPQEFEYDPFIVTSQLRRLEVSW